MNRHQAAPPASLAFTKGHGTENDFVLVPDVEGKLGLGAERVARLCDRRAGLGADGVIRVVRSEHCPEAAQSLALAPAAEWFMDHHNADGSAAEMCGNGIRVYAAYLLREGLVDPAVLEPDRPGLAVLSRGGVKRVHLRADGWFAVDMGAWAFPGGDEAVARGHDSTVHVHGLEVSRPALTLDLGNPHTVAMLSDAEELAGVELDAPPLVDPAPSHGTNVELLVALEPEDLDGEVVGRLAMRVHERGVGETRSCGTGACASALAARAWAGAGAPDRWLIDVPGGQVGVRVLPGERVELSGPAVLVADGVTIL